MYNDAGIRNRGGIEDTLWSYLYVSRIFKIRNAIPGDYENYSTEETSKSQIFASIIEFSSEKYANLILFFRQTNWLNYSLIRFLIEFAIFGKLREFL